MMEGWFCPVCGVTVSPYVQLCPMCLEKKKPEPEKAEPDPEDPGEPKGKVIPFHKK